MGFMKYFCTILIFTVFLSCTTSSQHKSTVQIDHIIVAVADLDRAIESVESLTGVRPVHGGEHPGRGTHNALLSLGEGIYLELIAAKPEVESEWNSLKGPIPIGFAVSVRDIEKAARQLKDAGFQTTEVTAGSRRTPDGKLLRWQTFGLEKSAPDAPFFIRWSPDSPHPSMTSPSGCTLTHIEIATPDASELSRLRDALDLDILISQSQNSHLKITIKCPNGTVTLPREVFLIE